MNNGLVIKAVGSTYSVKTELNEIIECTIKGKLRIKGLKSTNPVTVGDKVIFEKDTNAIGRIIEIQERKNYIIRKSTNLSKQYQIIAANVDQALLIITIIDPETQTDFIDRYLVSAEAFRIPVFLIFNKFDLYINDVYDKYLNLKIIYENIGYKCIETSVPFNKNIEELKKLCSNKITVFNGNSGVGKSSLIRSVDSTINSKVGAISEYHKSGMHTTSNSEMYQVNGDGYIIDTPGIRGFGLSEFDKNELYHFFPEIFKFSSGCKFYNCSHTHEPDCAVIENVKNDNIALSRYTSYVNLYHDDNKKYR